MPLQSRRRFFLAAAATLGLHAARAAEKAAPRIGFLSGAGYPELDQAFTGELRAQGLAEGRDVIIERRMARANTDDLRLMARELASADLALVVPTALPAALLVREANPRMPMVIGTCPASWPMDSRRPSSIQAASIPASMSSRPASPQSAWRCSRPRRQVSRAWHCCRPRPARWRTASSSPTRSARPPN
jgi:hypothetical protein